MNNPIYRQGDVLIQKIDTAIPTEATIVPLDKGRVVLAYGEVTGHSHAIADVDSTSEWGEAFCKPELKSTLYEWNGDRLLQIKQITALKHEEHAPITLEPGNYKVTIQKEYSPAAIRNVTD